MASSGMGSMSEYFSNLDFDSTVVKTFSVRGQTYLEIPKFQTQNAIIFIKHTVCNILVTYWVPYLVLYGILYTVSPEKFHSKSPW